MEATAMDSIKMDLLKHKDDVQADDVTDTTVIMEGDEGEEGELGSISSEEDGAGVDCIARSRLRPMRDIWPSDEIVQSLTSLDTWNAGSLVCAGRAEEALAMPGAAGPTMLWACWLGKPSALAVLLRGGADPLLVDPQGRSGLHLAALVGCVECVRLMLQHGTPPSDWDKDHKATPLHCAASAKSLACIQALIKHGADVNAGINDRSPLHYAVQSEAADCVQELLENGARADTPQVYTETPLHVAAALGSVSCTRLLLQYGASASAVCGPARLSALHLAAEDGYVACARELLDRGAPTDTRNKRQQTALHLACVAQALDMVELLVARGASTAAGDQDGRTPLHAALGRSSRGPDCARALLAAGADPDAPDNYGYTPVHLAALNEFQESVKLLLDHGGDVTMRTKGGQSALSFIVRRIPEVLPHYIRKFDDSIRVVDHEIGDVDCELKLDFRILVPLVGKLGGMGGRARGESNLLLSFEEVGRRDVLKHPLCETFLHLKWKRIRKFFFTSLVYHAVFVVLFSIYIIGIYSRNCPSLRASFDQPSCAVPLSIKVVGYFLLLMNSLLVCKELFQTLHDPLAYIKQWENWLQWLVILSVFLCAVPGSEENIKYALASWQHHVAAVGIFLVWLELMLIVGRFPMFGLYVQMFATVSVNFAKFLLAYSCLLIAFGLSFSVLFANYPPFKNAQSSLLKTLMMLAGELEYEDIFFNDNKEYAIQYNITAQIFFLAFVLLVTVILANLLVGLAVSDIQALQESAGLDRLVRQAGEVARLEALLFSPLLRWMPGKIRAMLHAEALLLAEPYRWYLVIRPNDPRENRLPKSIISSIYKLVASRKEQAKIARSNKPCSSTTNIFNKSSASGNTRTQFSVKKNVLRQRTTSDLTNTVSKNFLAPLIKRESEVGDVTKQMAELCTKMEQLQNIMETKMASFESILERMSKTDQKTS